MKIEYSSFKDWLIPAGLIFISITSLAIFSVIGTEIIIKIAQTSSFAAGAATTYIATIAVTTLRIIFSIIDEWYSLTKINILRGLTTNQFLAALAPLMLILFASGWAIAALTALAIWAYSLGGDIINPTIAFVYPTLWLIWGTTFALITELVQEQIWPNN